MYKDISRQGAALCPHKATVLVFLADFLNGDKAFNEVVVLDFLLQGQLLAIEASKHIPMKALVRSLRGEIPRFVKDGIVEIGLRVGISG